MADIAINPVTRRVQFTGNTGTGPFAFTFNILGDTDIAVYKNTTLLTLTTDYTVSINANGTGSVTLTGSGNGTALILTDILTIIGGRELSRVTDFVTAGDLLASSLNTDLDSLTVMAQQLDEKIDRSLKASAGDADGDLEIPLKSARLGRVLGFNATTGNPEAGPELTDVSSLADITTDIALLADIEDGTLATNAITTVSGNNANVTTVAGISSDVTAVSSNTSNINTVSSNLTGANTIGTVASNIANVNAVGGISSDVTTVATNDANITAVAADASDIGTVASNITNVNTVAGISADVTAAAAIDAADLSTLADNITDVVTVSDNISAVSNVSSNMSSVTGAIASATSASASAAAAASSATSAAASAASITGDVADAQAARVGAEAAYDSFDDRYLGAKTNDPTVDNDGNALLTGALYWNTTVDSMKAYDGSAWQTAYTTIDSSGGLIATNNLSDVSSATDSRTNLGLGTAAVADSTDFEAALAAISASTADTAVDVFVYDTSKDSDGGAWRNRTQNTSWYSETLNTATRGSRKQFPSVAVIVAETTKVTIYDGDDPDLPMWMVFNQGLKYSLHTGGSITSVFMLNGELRVGSAGSGAGNLSEISFISDTSGTRINSTTYYYVHYSLASRNAASNVTTTVSSGLVDRDVNDVAMTVLPSSPIAPSTGIQIPTIAVVTQNGISVIKDDGTVVNNSNTFARYGVTFGEDLTLLVIENTSSDTVEIYDYPDYLSAGFSVTRAISNSPILYPSLNNVGLYPANIVKSGKNESWAVGTSGGGINLFQGYTQSDMVAYAASDYTSGWMPGDIKGAFLASTDSTSLDGTTNLVSNGTFDSDLTGWATSSADWNWHSSERAYLNTTTNYQTISYDTNGGMEAGKSYIVTFDYELVTGSFRFAQTAVNDYTTVFSTTGSGTGTVIIGSQPTNANADAIQFRNETASTELYIDNVSITPADPDRSVNGNPLTVNGTITKSEVATGAELMAYSGWSASNYLEQPYNSDLDFGTGDFSIMLWVLGGSNAADHFVWIADPAGPGAHIALTKPASPDVCQIRVQDSGGGNDLIQGTKLMDSSNLATFVCAVRESGTLKLYEDGVLVGSTASSRSVSNSSATLTVGVSYNKSSNTGSDDKKLSLLRISATAPTAEQIRKIYEDEKYLFQENADCTLYGTSDAVTGLAYDSDTNLLHAGTSAGRSVFQGLRRVDNTTTAVGTAISAQNNLVADE